MKPANDRPSLELDGDGMGVPGGVLKGAVRGESPIHGEVRLFWSTVGRGTTDVEVVARWPLTQGSHFTFVLPAAPVSFSGTLVGVEWALEWVDGKGRAVAECGLVVSPTGCRVELPKVEKPAHKKLKTIFHPFGTQG
ncbi:hypothetical protein HNR46_000648 [Haloferula luteola]|uniref:Uncharacterized protein n=1 Tax=Haloferula luteola TaxID=595692 RepID=A0A840V449_9BACT|nr:hypothetical protein [Haloferula luteola]MBB5350424.1 hypothetical protein [Haloferula luteola]